MKSGLIMLLLLPGTLVVGQSFFDRADAFFAEYVQDGQVSYAQLRKQPEALKELVREIATTDLSNRRVTPGFLKAFYINAYNILVIDAVVQRYPIEGPLAVDGFFDKIMHTVMGEEMTLDHLEKKILMQQFPDPRLHFVLVCAAKGCPPLVSFSYKPETVEQQLTQRTREVLNLDWFIRVNKENVKISRLFDWYRTDFTKGNDSLIGYINQYRHPNIDPEKPVDFYEYDWSLNEMK